MMRKTRIKTKYSDNSYWKSYSDMMAALLLMFILIMTLALAKADENNQLIKKQEAEIEMLLGIKPKIVQELKEELSEFEVSIDENTGDIEFKSDILFDYNQDILKSEGTAFLARFMPKYLSVILSDKYLPHIAEIIVEGHTDTEGGYTFNLQLSQERALSVATFIVGEGSKFVSGENIDYLRKIITVTGKSYTHPIYTDNSHTQIDAAKSRRVELKFRLKDDETIGALEKILNGE